MHERAAEIKAALAGPLLWNQSAGMFRPSSGNCAHLVDIWGSALAVHIGATTPHQTAAIVNWFGKNWRDVFQDGQVRHLPRGYHWPVIGPAVAPSPGYWEYDTYQNGGYWATPLAWVAPVLAMADTRLAARVVREAIADGKQHGLNEWINHEYCSNCAGEAVPVPSQPRLGGGPPQMLTAYPMSGEWWGGAMNYGSSIASVYLLWPIHMYCLSHSLSVFLYVSVLRIMHSRIIHSLEQVRSCSSTTGGITAAESTAESAAGATGGTTTNQLQRFRKLALHSSGRPADRDKPNA